MQQTTIEVTENIAVVKYRIMPDVLYNNKEIRAILGVDERLIRKYRDYGYLSYHRIDDKFWYKGTDILDFLERSSYPAFA